MKNIEIFIIPYSYLGCFTSCRSFIDVIEENIYVPLLGF